MIQNLVIKQHGNKKRSEKEKPRVNVWISKSLNGNYYFKSAHWKLTALVCLMILRPEHFVVQRKENFKGRLIAENPLSIFAVEGIINRGNISSSFFFRSKQESRLNLTFRFWGTFFWGPIPVNRSGYRSR